MDLTALPGQNGAIVAQPGDTLRFQFWHRDVPTGNSNFTPAIRVPLACEAIAFDDRLAFQRGLQRARYGDFDHDGRLEVVCASDDRSVTSERTDEPPPSRLRTSTVMDVTRS